MISCACYSGLIVEVTNVDNDYASLVGMLMITSLVGGNSSAEFAKHSTFCALKEKLTILGG